MTDFVADEGAAAAPHGLQHAFASLRHRDYALFFGAATVSNIGNWMQTITVPYVIYVITRSTTWLGFTAFMTFFPSVLIGPVSGAIADRFSRQRVLLVTLGLQTLVALALWVLWVSGTATPASLVMVLLVSGLISGVNITSWQAFVPALVPREDLLNAVRLNSIQFTAARAFGPALAGLILARFGPGTAFMANAISFVPVIATLAVVRPRPTPVDRSQASVLRQFLDGVAYVRARQALVLAVMTMLVVSLLPSSLVQLAPAFATAQFHVSKSGYGFLVATFGAGSIVGSVSMAAQADRFRRSRLAIVGLLGSALGVLLLASSTRFAVGLGALAVMGVAYLAIAVSLNTAIQVRVAEVYRGRVVSIYLMGLLAGLPLGSLVLGTLADAIGLRVTTVVTAAALLAYVVVVTARFGGLRALDETVDDEGDENDADRDRLAEVQA